MTHALPAGAQLRFTIRDATPNWFTVTMGTGILALAMNQAAPALRPLAQALWAANIALFTLFTAAYLARWLCYGREAAGILSHSTMSMFLGAIPMALATIINGLLVFGVPLWGEAAVRAAQTLWWVDAALSAACGIAVPFLMFTRQDHAMERMTGLWLLPVVASEVAAVSAAQLLPFVTDPHAAMRLLLLGYVLWALSVPAALSLLVLLLQRLVVHKLPPADMAGSAWLALGPLGTGALGLLLLGADAAAACRATGLAALAEMAQGLGILGGTVLWGYGAWWLGLALLITGRYLRQGMPFNLGWWGFTFPLGVYSLATMALGRATFMPGLVGLGQALVAALAVIWAVVATQTLAALWRGARPAPRQLPAPGARTASLPDKAQALPLG